MKSNRQLVLELRQEYQRSRYGLTVEEQRPITTRVLKEANEANIPELLITCEDDAFPLFSEKYIK